MCAQGSVCSTARAELFVNNPSLIKFAGLDGSVDSRQGQRQSPFFHFSITALGREAGTGQGELERLLSRLISLRFADC